MRHRSRALPVAGLLLMLAGAGAAYWWHQGKPALPSLQRPAATVIAWPAAVLPLTGGAQGYADGPASQARFADPYGMVADRDGKLYVADAGQNNLIRTISPEGMVSTLAGHGEGMADGLGAQASFNTPSGLAIDKAGNLYVADTGNNAIRKVTPQGQVSTVAGNGKAGFADGAAAQALFNGPVGIAVDDAGNLYVADTYNDRIRLITPAGQVSTLAGGDRPGFVDGPANQALLDTPCAIALGPNGVLYIADTRNGAIRVLEHGGQLRTLARGLPDDRQSLLRRPLGLAVSHDGVVYVGDGARGRLLQVTATGEVRGLTGIGIDIAIGDVQSLRFGRPAAIVIDSNGALAVSDATSYAVRKVVPRGQAAGVVATTLAAVPTLAAAANAAPAPATVATVKPAVAHAAAAVAIPAVGPARAVGETSAPSIVPALLPQRPARFPWPLKPQYSWHEIVGTMGEVRGNYDGEARDHFHNGLDIQADMGTPVLAVVDEKVSSPVPNWAFGDIGEGIGIDSMAYIHMRVGRTLKDAPIDPARFQILPDEHGKPARVRVKRGTRFAIGDMLGTVNRMYHVHLAYSPAGATSNPQALPFEGAHDLVPPHIDSIELFAANGQPLAAPAPKAGKAGKGGKAGKAPRQPAARVVVPRTTDGIAIVVDAYDQMDGNAARRRLGLYKLGYQVLHADGTPVPGDETPHMNIEFNRLPPDQESVKVAYAANSGITVHGNASTRFLYVVTNSVRDGHAIEGKWKPAGLPAGDYIIRVTGYDYAGNAAVGVRELPISLR